MKFNQSLYFAFVLILCTFGFNPAARGEQDNIYDAGFVVAQENEDDEEKDNEPELKGIPKNIDKIAEKITVRIDSPDGNGSGVIFARKNNEYFVVTAKHVVDREQNYQVVTDDDEVHEADPLKIKRFRDNDLAVLSFTSDEDYQVAAFSDYNLGLNQESWVFVYGWAKTEEEPEPLFTAGKVVGKETGIFLVKDDLSLSKTDGYELIYTNISSQGMSGGPVLDTNGRVIGIHTSAEGERYRLTNKLQLGFSLGVPIGTFLESEKLQLLAKSKNLELQTIKERPDRVPFIKSNLSKEEIESLDSISFPSPGNDATETAWVNYGNQLWRSFQYTEAITAFNRAINKKTNFHQAYYGKGLALHDLGKYQQANQAFAKAVKLKPDFYPAWYRQSLALLNMRRYPKALDVIDRAIVLQPDNTALYALRGEALQNIGRYEDAVKAYNRAIAESENPLILARRGSIYRILARQDLALQDFDRAIKFDPGYAEGYVNRALTYYQLGDNQQALTNLNHAIRIPRRDARAYLARGFVSQELGDTNQAKADFIRAFNLYNLEQEIQAQEKTINPQNDNFSPCPRYCYFYSATPCKIMFSPIIGLRATKVSLLSFSSSRSKLKLRER